MIRTHKFRLGRYRIEFGRVEACCDVPGDDGDLAMITPPVTDYHTFALAAHEAEHADGIPDSIIHDSDGYPVHGGRHRFLWRIVQGLIKEGT